MVQETRSIGSVRLYSDLETSALFLYCHCVWDNIVFLDLLCTAYIETATSWFTK